MLKNILKFKNILLIQAFKLFEHSFRLIALASYLAISFGLLGTFLLVFNPTIDDDIARSIIRGLISKYNNLDSEEKNQIRDVFREIFLAK